MISGFLLIDKPVGMTSHDVIAKLRRITGVKKIGHAGTLDPNASGLLVVGVGREATKHLGVIAKDTVKKYEGHIFLGMESTTDDEEGEKTENKKTLKPSGETLNKVIASLLGEQSQVPPVYSAIKKNGKKAYELARKGKSVTMEPRNIVIHEIKLLEYSYPDLYIFVTVSSGTYIRALARDIGKKLKTGAYLKDLRRTGVGSYSVNEAFRLDDITSSNWQKALFQLQ